MGLVFKIKLCGCFSTLSCNENLFDYFKQKIKNKLKMFKLIF